MTNREKTALGFVALGALLALVAAAAYGGWKAAIACAAVLAIGFGVLLALDEPSDELEPAAGEPDDELLEDPAVIPPTPDDPGGYPVSVSR